MTVRTLSPPHSLISKKNNFMQAFERDKGRKGKISKKRKKGKKKVGKKGKKKKEKDLTPDRSTESLYEELVVNGIIRPFPNVPLSDFIGDINMVASEVKKKGSKYPQPGGGDIRRLIAEYCILPMSKGTYKNNSIDWFDDSNLNDH